MRNLVSRWCVLALLFVPFATSAAWAQTFTGGVRGVVTDSGGVVPGVTVTLINESNGASRDAVSNELGLYDFSAVQPGVYTVKAELTGFKTFENKGIRVGTQQFVTMDIRLDVGQLQETITVTGAAPLIDTSNASTGSVIDSRQLEALPSGGRSAFLFAVTVPTVVASGDAQFNRQQDQTNASLLSLGGGARRANNYLVDGVPVTDLRNRASANPSIEALEGVNVQVHQYDAETGRTGGGTFNVATKSGGNEWHGSGFYQARPKWGTANNFYAARAGTPLPNTYYHLGGGGVGGPVIRNRTFFWFTAEGYGSMTTRNGAVRVPTTREKAGDFSQTRDSAGNLQIIYDPLTGDANGNGRQPFPGNIIPANRLNAVGVKMLSYLPNPTRDVSQAGNNNFDTIARIEDRAMMYTGKLDHRFNDKVSLNGFYLYNATDEPCANLMYPGLNDPNRFVDRQDYLLIRRVQVLALNNTWLPSNNTVATLRYGMTKFIDDDTLSIDYDPAELGFSSNFLNNLQVKKFPRVTVTDYREFGAIDPTPRNWYSWSANGTVSRLFGSHTVKLGADWRTIGIETQSFTGGAGTFLFDRLYTSQNPLTVSNASGGNALASLLLGYPSGDPSNQSSMTVSAPFNAFVHYMGAYLQDDWRVNSRFTLNYGLRLERETGLREENNGFTVGFDRTANPGGALGAVVNPLTGQPIRGGLMYAGVNGNNEYQGNPPALKVSPRVGMVYSFNPKTVVRAGYGIYWAPWNYQAVGPANYGNVGFTQQTFITQDQFRPTTSLTDPFQSIQQPRGSSRGLLEGVGSQIEFIDQEKTAPQIHQYSVDLMRELPRNMAVGFEYVGATGRDLGLGGSNDGIININQVPSQFLSLGSALLEQVPNPFFGLPAGQGKSVTSPTIQRRELLRPFPQFNDILMRQATLGKSQYHAAVLKLEKRMSNGWAGRLNYTYSRLKDNQFGEGNFFSQNPGEMQDVKIGADDYGVDAEWAVGLLDVPHKLTFSPIVELPFGEGKRWAQGGIGNAILGDWTISSIISIESGFPTQVYMGTQNTQLFTRMQRANPGTGDAYTDGTRYERITPPTGSGCLATEECGSGLWLNRAAFSQPAAFTLGTLPRTLPDVRTPHRNNWDFVAAKDVRLKGNMRGELKFEVLNITNTPKVRGPETRVDNGSFGQIRTQSGFMRITQLNFRLTF